MKIAMRDFFDELFKDYDDFILQNYIEEKDFIIVYFSFNQRKLRLLIVNYDSQYERGFFAEEQVEESFSYPHAYNRDENGWISYCLLEKEDFVLTSLSLEDYLRLYITQLYELLTLSPRQKELEYQKEFLIYWKNEAYRTSKEHQIKDFTIYSTLCEVAKEVSYFRKEENGSESGYIADANEDVNDWHRQTEYQVEKALYVPIVNTQRIRPPTLSLQWDRSTLLSIFSNPYADHISSQSHTFISKLKCSSYRKIVVLKMTPPQMEPIVFAFIVAFKNNYKKRFLEKVAEDFEKIILLECKTFSIEHLVARTATATSFKEKNILLIGAGSIGSYLALQLSKFGIRKLTISDTKNFNYETVLRNYLGAGSIFSHGNKARLLKYKIELDAPWLHIDAWDWNILLKDRKEQQRLLSEFDLIIVATGGSDTQRRFNAAFHDIGLSCPIIFDWLDSEGKGLHAVVMNYKNKGCYECLFSEDGKQLGSNKVSFADGTEKIHRNGCNGSFTTYGNDVLSRNTSMMLPLIQTTLLSGVEENYLVSIRNDFSSLETALTMKPTIKTYFASKGCVICGGIQKLEQVEKFSIGTGHTADLSIEIMPTLMKYLQINYTATEAGGFLLGYENAISGNITINSLTEPQSGDGRSRMNFIRKHRLPKRIQLEGYIGTWHTHPQNIPIPSSTDYRDWKRCIQVNQKATDRLVFIIAGTSELRVWIGDCINGIIYEAAAWKR